MIINIVKNELEKRKHLIKFFFLRLIGDGISLFFPLVIARFLSPESFGSFSLSRMIIFLIGTLLIASVQGPFIVLANQERTKTGKINKTFSAYLILIAFSILLFVIINLFLRKFVLSFTGVSYHEFFFMILAFVGYSLKGFFIDIMLATNKRITSSLVELTFGISNFILLFLFMFFNLLNLQTIFLIYFISGLIVCIVFFFQIKKALIFPISFNKKITFEMIHFIKWVAIGGAAVYLINWGDNIVLRYFVPIDKIGVYNLSSQIFKAFIGLNFILNAYFLPYLSSNINNEKKIKHFLFKERPLLFSVMLIAIIFISFFLPGIIMNFYKGIYNDAILPLRILFIANIFALYNIFYLPILNSYKRYRFTQCLNIIQALSQIIMGFLFVPIFGISGAAIAISISYLIYGVIQESYIFIYFYNLSIFNKKNIKFLFSQLLSRNT